MKSVHGFETTSERSDLMRRIRSKDTKPEMILRKALWAKGLRYRINVKNLPGKPDIVIRKLRLAIFVDGEFWHGYKWIEKKPRILSNREYWVKKIEGNISRDRENVSRLKEQGFCVIRFWQHEIQKDLAGCLRKIVISISRGKGKRYGK